LFISMGLQARSDDQPSTAIAASQEHYADAVPVSMDE